MIKEFYFPELLMRTFQHTLYQQDGASAHAARVTVIVLNDCFSNRLISGFGHIPWPFRAPDLTTCDFF